MLRRGQLSADGFQYILAKHVAAARKVCPSLKHKRVTPHMLRHTMAMELLQAGVDITVIALWLGHRVRGHHQGVFGRGSRTESEDTRQNHTAYGSATVLSTR